MGGPAFAAAGDGGRPQNSLTGQLFVVNSGASGITVPPPYKNLRLWRNTAVDEPGRRAVAHARARRPTRSASSGTSTPTTASVRAA